jgi:hypothetical protein
MNNDNEKQEQKQEDVDTHSEEAVKFVGSLEIDNLKQNSVLKILVHSPEGLMNILFVLRDRYGKIIKDKNITVVALGEGDTIEEIDEKSMEQFGWVRKEPSRIITLS